ncbi:hypothetical protein CISIN_1g038646mg [Citrus sinensis]|uniref:Uncharacterized protein n=1 Tax=Citrus sinensis TaxID=2711 RepID=A0A067ES16_CITSI|nr:hypothetical protein CISIN_1g038646mg [Citrus sinensis]
MPTFETLPHLEVLKLKLNSYFGRKSFRKFVLWWPRPELKPALQVFMDKEQYDTQLWNMINLVLTYHVFSMFHLKLV